MFLIEVIFAIAVLLAAGLFVLVKWSTNFRNLLGIRKDQIEIKKTQLDIEEKLRSMSLIHRPSDSDIELYDRRVRQIKEKAKFDMFLRRQIDKEVKRKWLLSTSAVWMLAIVIVLLVVAFLGIVYVLIFD